MILTVADRCTRPQHPHGMASDRSGNDRLATERFRHGKTIPFAIDWKWQGIRLSCYVIHVVPFLTKTGI